MKIVRREKETTVVEGGGAPLRERIDKFRGARRRNIVGVPEFIGLTFAALMLFAAIVSYFYFLLPARTRLQRAGEERTKLQSELRLSSEGIKRGESTQASVDEIIQSLEEFETRHLVARHEAATSVIEELNSLIRRNRLNISTGISFTQFDSAAADDSSQTPQGTVRAGGRVKALQNVFPGIGISLTVEGTYQNLRRFIHDIEADRRFIVINGVELEGVTDAGARAAANARSGFDEGPAAQPGGAPPQAEGQGGAASPATPARGATLVSLRLDMAAYFRRPTAPG